MERQERLAERSHFNGQHDRRVYADDPTELPTAYVPREKPFLYFAATFLLPPPALEPSRYSRPLSSRTVLTYVRRVSSILFV
jgi:hypothetical protein